MERFMVPRAVGSDGLVILKSSARAADEASRLAHKEARKGCQSR